ncbi:MAG: hypothetical protein A2827_02790 [Candidatus Spechtbacteria bacterium RIFCSPHIGHO2_01_FULL_43_30]|uniref:Uncharacterized protein n=1 Tax=Candidatus Spechtbacteria bacterium RIFCSPHIGHO2_01_FULL_43_30 TaxID=1802158 RepID=A0A1G2H6N0_9BACT|nr:MAG: hypothetical protein A2827_02790 [Candidatus Spechtbacteria bacterium RIFCSPHIGHO2_01_FULL_43_30]
MKKRFAFSKFLFAVIAAGVLATTACGTRNEPPVEQITPEQVLENKIKDLKGPNYGAYDKTLLYYEIRGETVAGSSQLLAENFLVPSMVILGVGNPPLAFQQEVLFSFACGSELMVPNPIDMIDEALLSAAVEKSLSKGEIFDPPKDASYDVSAVLIVGKDFNEMAAGKNLGTVDLADARHTIGGKFVAAQAPVGFNFTAIQNKCDFPRGDPRRLDAFDTVYVHSGRLPEIRPIVEPASVSFMKDLDAGIFYAVANSSNGIVFAGGMVFGFRDGLPEVLGLVQGQPTSGVAIVADINGIVTNENAILSLLAK